MKKMLSCDDDHFASSEIELEVCPKPKGVVMKIHAQFGEENYAFLHPSEIEAMIGALTEMRTRLDKL